MKNNDFYLSPNEIKNWIQKPFTKEDIEKWAKIRKSFRPKYRNGEVILYKGD